MTQRTPYIAAFLALVTFGLYLHTAGPTLVPYRDAGEMATSVTQLGVLHPPGYPLYTLIGHLFTRLPLANPAYLLNMLSSLALAAAWGVLLIVAVELWGVAAAVLTVFLGAVSFQFWGHALVSEMYTMNMLTLSSLFYLLHRRRFNAAAFLFGLGLGARMDLVLCAPALACLYFGQTDAENRWPRVRTWLLYSLLGFSVYLYLWIRAGQQPLLNWGDPSTFERFWASLIRRSYASTLDLLSKSYVMGENFGSEFTLYMVHLGRDFSLLSFPLAAWGLRVMWKTNRIWFGTAVLGWLFTGPMFIFLGNLPPNPHAVAIMEASYLTPDIFYLLMIGFGLSAFNVWPKLYAALGCLLAILIAAQAGRFYPALNKRNNWVASDFARNALYSVPEPSLIVAHSDVPIFSLFYGYWVYPGFKWRVPVAQGLSGSPWYQVMMNRQVDRLNLESLKTSADWEAVAKANPGWSLYGTPDTDWPADLYARMVPAGLLLQYVPRGKASIISSDTLLSELMIYRGRYRYDAYHEFFTPELVEEYAKAWMEWGRLALRSGQADAAADAFRHALSHKPDMPYPAFQLGFIYFQQNKLPQAEYYYHWAVDNFRRLDRQAQEWKSFAPIREGLQRDQAQAIAHWGVIHERMGDSERAISLYLRALDIDPKSADARYNLAVLYWRAARWQEVVDQLQALAAAHPEDQRWRVYLPKALERLKSGG